jgi:hypothetical protein
MCIKITSKGIEEIGDPREIPLYGGCSSEKNNHDPHWDSSELDKSEMEHKYLLTVKGLPVKISAEEEVVILKGRIKRGEKF